MRWQTAAWSWAQPRWGNESRNIRCTPWQRVFPYCTRQARVALLFGSEKTGLSNDALSHCNWLMTIPMHSTPGLRHASMNLGQAAAVCLYELVRQAESQPLSEPQPMALAEDQERVTGLLTELLAGIGYGRRRPASAHPSEVRRMVRRLNLNQSDARRWIGILRQLLWKISE